MAEQGSTWSDKALQDYRDIKKKVDSALGPGNTTRIHKSQIPRTIQDDADVLFWVEITAVDTSTRSHAWKRLSDIVTVSTAFILPFTDHTDTTGTITESIIGIQGTTSVYPLYDQTGKVHAVGTQLLIRPAIDFANDFAESFIVVSTDTGLVGEISAEPSDGLYTFVMRLFDNTNVMANTSPEITLTGSAIEVNGRKGIPSSTIVVLSYVGNDSSGNPFYAFEHDSANSGTPDSSVAYTHAEHAEAADSNTWDRENQGTNRGATVTVQTGQFFDDTATTPVLYAYLRDITIDASGHITNIGAETRVTIDTPDDDCT